MQLQPAMMTGDDSICKITDFLTHAAQNSSDDVSVVTSGNKPQMHSAIFSKKQLMH